MDLSATQAAFAAALLDPELPVPSGLKADPKRFAVYRNNVAVGLRKALASNFPVVEKLVGGEFFAVMARAYIARTRPASPLIFAYGDDFPDFIAGFEPAATVPYLADVARLERAWLDAYHAADAEPLDVAALAGLDEAALATARLKPHPAARLVASAFAAGSIWQAHQEEPIRIVAANGGECVLIARPGFDVTVTVRPRGDAAFAQELLSGATIGDAAARGVATDPAFDFGRAIVGLFTLGAFAALMQSDGVSPP
jgi:hypothetical protein